MKHSLEERILALHEELAAVIDEYVEMRAAQVPGVHRGSVENSILARAGGCRCQEFRTVQKLKTAAEELARKQQADAI